MHHLAVLVLLVTLSVVYADPMWKVFCNGQPIYRGRADPIVTPGATSGHSHRVFGASNFDLGSTSRSPLDQYNYIVQSPCTTCSLSADKSAYWVPDLYYQWPDGSFSLVPTAGLTVYYPSRSGSGAQAQPHWQAFPKGLRMLAGSPTRRTYNASDNNDIAVSYSCLGVSGPETPAFPADISQCTWGLRAQLWFPMCWDGVNVDSPNHKDHMSYPIEAVNFGNCPASHPVRVPGIFFEALFSITGFPKQSYNPFRWSPGDPTGYGFHGDFLNGWDSNILQAAILDPTCDSTNTNNGNNVAACNALSPYIIADNSRCLISNPIHNIEDLGYNHPIAKLPGCNPVTPGGTGTCGGPEASIGPDWRRFLLQSKNSPLFVSAKDIYTDLTASVAIPYYSEVWTMVSVGNGQFAVKSEVTGQYLTSPRGDALICNRNSPSTWEYFIFTSLDGTYYSIQSLSNNYYISLAADGTLHADSPTVGDAQKWKLVDPGLFIPGGSGPPSNFKAVRAVSDQAENYQATNSGSAPFPLWIVGVVVGVAVVVVIIVIVIVVASRKSKVETV